MKDITKLYSMVYAPKRTAEEVKATLITSQKRFDKALSEVEKEPTKIEDIIKYTNEILLQLEMKAIENPKFNPQEVNYLEIKKEYGTRNVKDIVWMKFTKEGYLGVVAVSDDINFNIPSKKITHKVDKEKLGISEKVNTSGTLVRYVDKEWDDSMVLVFPLVNIPEAWERSDIERIIGNYLLEKDVAIIDFYSHRF